MSRCCLVACQFKVFILNMLFCFRMATSGSVSGILDRVSCRVCMEPFDNNTHVPKLLPCQHTFCNSCLCELINNSFDLDTIECPVCRSKHTIPANGFTTNRIALDIVEELHANSARPNALKCSTHAIDVLPKAPLFVATYMIYLRKMANVLHRILLVVNHACKFTFLLLHRVITYVTVSCKTVIANGPLFYAAFAFSVTIVALLLLCVIDSVTPQPEGFVNLAINYVTYVCKVFITNAVLFVVTFVIDSKKNNRTVRLDRAFFKDWPFGTLIWSFMYLFTHCVSFVMTVLFQFLLSSCYIPDNLKSGMVFYMVYCLEIMINHAVWLLFVTLLILSDDGKLKFDQKQLQIYAFMYSYHIVAHIVVSFDYAL